LPAKILRFFSGEDLDQKTSESGKGRIAAFSRFLFYVRTLNL